MSEKDSTTWGLATWLLALGMAFGGGAVNWCAKVNEGTVMALRCSHIPRLWMVT